MSRVKFNLESPEKTAKDSSFVATGPLNFIWGITTSAFQTEGAPKVGGRTNTDWDVFEKIPGKIADGNTANIASDSFKQYANDVRLVKEMGLNSYRFSLSWTRIVSDNTGKINQAGIDHYNALINNLKENGIEPFVDLSHWDTPQWIESYGGLLDQTGTFIKDFVYFANICFQNFGDRVKYWTTFNEPSTPAVNGYEFNVFAPSVGNSKGISPYGYEYRVIHNSLLAHAYAVKSYRENFLKIQNGTIGIVINVDWAVPFTQTKRDIDAAERYMIFQGALLWDPLFFGKYPKIVTDTAGTRLPKFTPEESALLIGSFDIMYLGHCTAFYVRNYEPTDEEVGWVYDSHTTISYTDPEGKLIGKPTQSVWNHIVPETTYGVLEFYYNRYKIQGHPGISIKVADKIRSVPIMFVENGVALSGENQSSTYEECKNDVDRIEFFEGGLRYIQKAIKDFSLNYVGYSVWTLSDNFEWNQGYKERFGLHYTDFNFPGEFRPAYPKDSVVWLRKYIQDHPDGLN